MKKKELKITEELWTEAERILMDTLVIEVAEFDRRLTPLVEQIEAQTTIEGSSRTRRENLIDHVKAWLTRQGMTRRIPIRGVPHLVWWPVAGTVRGEDLMPAGNVMNLLHAVVRVAEADKV